MEKILIFIILPLSTLANIEKCDPHIFVGLSDIKIEHTNVYPSIDANRFVRDYCPHLTKSCCDDEIFANLIERYERINQNISVLMENVNSLNRASSTYVTENLIKAYKDKHISEDRIDAFLEFKKINNPPTGFQWNKLAHKAQRIMGSYICSVCNPSSTEFIIHENKTAFLKQKSSNLKFYIEYATALKPIMKFIYTQLDFFKMKRSTQKLMKFSVDSNPEKIKMPHRKTIFDHVGNKVIPYIQAKEILLLSEYIWIPSGPKFERILHDLIDINSKYKNFFNNHVDPFFSKDVKDFEKTPPSASEFYDIEKIFLKHDGINFAKNKIREVHIQDNSSSTFKTMILVLTLLLFVV